MSLFSLTPLSSFFEAVCPCLAPSASSPPHLLESKRPLPLFLETTTGGVAGFFAALATVWSGILEDLGKKHVFKGSFPRSVPHLLLQYTRETKGAHFSTPAFSRQSRSGDFRSKLEAVDGLGPSRGLDGDPRTGMVWRTFTPRNGRRDEIFHAPWEGFFDIRASFGRANAPLSLAGMSLVAKNSTGPRCFPRLSLRESTGKDPITESFEDSNVRTRGRAEAASKILGDPSWHMARNQNNFVRVLAQSMKAPLPIPVFKACVKRRLIFP
ncbi:hypothetical protein GWK47_017430 [Chionoecetes opilio]|uniref:Uncharacterized protein n=1 Tax=Chionoecetes opilio TaxID=41210 RepID=A0A8J5CJT3_CHIOP|nr:hypothetical protein GWK47_017430 [Chionoecetes opilio]